MTERTFAERARRRYLRASADNSAGPGDTSKDINTTGREGHLLLRNNNSTRVENAPGVDPLPAVSSSLATSLLMGAALLALELANAATSYYALASFMGGAGVWRASFALLLTLGLATLDAGGLYRLFHPATAGSTNRSFALWCAMGAWLICATTNAILTWWAVSDAMAGHVTGNAVLSTEQLLDVTPVFLALALWLMRLLLVAGWAQGERG